MNRTRGHDAVLRSRRTVLPDGERPATVVVREGVITAVLPYDTDPAPSVEPDGVVDLGADALLPGMVDTHVHVNEPGRTEWEGFATATRAAARGGVTTLVDMPLNSLPPTVDVASLTLKRAAAAGHDLVRVGFWGGAVPGNLSELRRLHRAGVVGFKCFLADSGVPEFPPLTIAELERVLREIRQFDGLLAVHAEDAASLGAAPDSPRYVDFLRSRPVSAETRAIGAVAEAAARTGARVHILHLSSAEALPIIARARAAGVRLTTETCPHYLALAAEDVPDGATEFKCCPPIRERENADRLWQGLADGLVDCVVSDHSPCTPSSKTGSFGTAWGGISSLQLGPALVWTEARRRGFGLADLVRWMARAPADLVGHADRGRIAVGCRGDLVRFAPESTAVVRPHDLAHRHPVTPYAGRRLAGVVRRTWLGGIPL